MDIFGSLNPLFLLIAAPMLFAVVVALLPAQNKALLRWVTLGFSLIVGAFSVAVFFAYNQFATPGQFGFEMQTEWFKAIGASWHLGMDGISAAMVLLTGILTPLAVLISWEIEDRPNMHLALLLMFEGASMGVFVSMDLLIFFVFYELSLVPMYFLINQWGGPNRKYASTKFFLYSVGGTLGMLLATQLIGFTTGTYDIRTLIDPTAAQSWVNFQGANSLFLGINIGTVKGLAFLGFFVAFCIKVPVWPFHTWLPDAHGEAPTAGSMLLAGVMLKLGAYGFIRLVIPLFPDVWVNEINILGIATNAAGIFAFLAMLSIVFGAFAAYAENDIKRLVAYSSVNHMGFVAIGIAVMAVAYGNAYLNNTAENLQSAIIATNGAVLQMFNHGLSSAAMFLLAGGIYHKTHTRDMREYGGFWVKAPIYGAIFIFASMASLGLPGLNGFVGEFLVVRGSWPVFTWLTVIAMIGLLFTGSYILKGIRAVLHGPFNLHWRDYNLEIERRELIAIAPLLALILVTGVAPNWVLTTINDTVTHILSNIANISSTVLR